MLNHDRMLVAFVCLLALIFAPLLVLAEETEDTEEATTATVIISEVGWAGSEINDSDEWLELTNLSDQTIDLTGWSLAGAATGGDVLVLPDQASVAANSTYLISNYADDDEKSTLNIVANHVTSSLSLSNSSFGISLQDALGTVIDVTGTGSAPPTGSRGTNEEGETEPRSSMQRLYLIDGSLDEAWVSATESVGFDEGATELGTPGIPETPVTHETLETLNSQTYDEYQNDPEDETEEEPEDTVTETDPTDSSTSSLIINEFVSDPITGESEWVEIYNPTETVFILAGYQIREASGKLTDLPDQYLAADQYAVAEGISGNLNNGGDTIELLDPEGNIIDQVSFGDGTEAPAVSDPNAVALNENNEWVETTISTPGAANVISDEVQEVVVEETEEEAAEETEEIEETEEEVVEPTETPETLDTPEIPVTFEALTTLSLSEIYANTEGADSEEEFIEITNTGSEPVDLQGWSLTDASEKTHTINDSLTIEPGAFLALYRETTNLSLNNNGIESVALIAPDDVVIDQITYDSTTKGQSYIFINGAWVGTTKVTPNESNVFSQLEADATESTEVSEPTVESVEVVENTESTVVNKVVEPVVRVVEQVVPVYQRSSSSSSVTETTLAAVRSLSKGTKVRTTGTVSAEPGLLGKQIMYLAGSGIQVYLYAANWPDVSVGDVVQVNGELSSSRSETRIKLASADDLVVLYDGDEPIPHEVELEEVDDDTEGWLVMVTGLVTSTESDRFEIEDNGTTTTILIKEGTNINLSSIEVGSQVQVIGIVSRYYDNFRVLPRSSSDIEVLQGPVIAVAGTSAKDQAAAGRSGYALGISFVACLILGYLAFRYYRSRNLDQPKFTARTVECGTPS
jgi:hypothetical protein